MELQTQAQNREVALVGQSIESLHTAVNLIRRAHKELMREGVHYGTIPGTQKPTLFQPGADLLCMLFGLRAEFVVQSATRQDSFIAYTIECRLHNIAVERQLQEMLLSQLAAAGKEPVLGPGCCEALQANALGSANSREKRYRRAGGDVWDLDNTLQKMAQKRAKTAAVRAATAASEVFTEDLEDDLEPMQDRPSQPRQRVLKPKIPGNPPRPQSPPRGRPEPSPRSKSDTTLGTLPAIYRSRLVELRDYLERSGVDDCPNFEVDRLTTEEGIELLAELERIARQIDS